MSDVRVAGVGMAPFARPREGRSYLELGEAAVRAALADAGIDLADVAQAFASYVYGDSTCGQAVLYRVGMTGLPVLNVNNNCASGSSALWLARQAVDAGADVVLAFGFEQMRPGAIGAHWDDRDDPLGSYLRRVEDVEGPAPVGTPPAALLFGAAGREHQERFGTSAETFARIAVKARRHAAANPNAVFRDPLTLAEVLAAPPVHGPLTRLQCCPPTSGAAAVVLVSGEFARRRCPGARVRIAGQALTSDRPSTFTGDLRQLVGSELTARAAAAACEQAGIGPRDLDVVELHDCFTTNELISCEALGLTPEGTGEEFVLAGENTYGGRVVVNPSGGLLSKGHPLGATGLAQCAELTWQLRGQAGARQVEGARTALQHNIGIGSACVVTVYEDTVDEGAR